MVEGIKKKGKYYNCGGGTCLRMRSENNKIVEAGIMYLTLFVLNGISCLILSLTIISRVFNQLIVVKLFVL